jgi:hypothetical protein
VNAAAEAAVTGRKHLKTRLGFQMFLRRKSLNYCSVKIIVMRFSSEFMKTATKVALKTEVFICCQ